MHPKWKYVYWSAIFSLYGFMALSLNHFVEGSAATAAVTLGTLLCASGVSTFIEGKLHWGVFNIIRTPENQWKCLECGKTGTSRSDLRDMQHRLMFTCKDNDGVSGCGKKVYQCHTDKVKHQQIKRCLPCDKLYRGCTKEHGKICDDQAA